MMRGIAYWIASALFTSVVAVVILLLYPFFGIFPRLPHAIMRFWARTVLTVLLGCRLEVSGAEVIDPEKSYIIVSNHRSYLDILVCHAASSLSFLWLAKRSLFSVPGFGLVLRAAGFIPVEREKRIAASRSLERAAEALARGMSVWFFPEGTRTPFKELGRFRRGAFLLAAKTGSPVLPAVLANTDRIFKRPLIIEPKPIRVKFSPPLCFEDFAKGGKDERGKIERIAHDVRSLMQEEYDRASLP